MSDDSSDESYLEQQKKEDDLIEALLDSACTKLRRKEFKIPLEDWNDSVRENCGGALNAHSFHKSHLWDRFCRELKARIQADKKFKFKLSSIEYGEKSSWGLLFIVEL